MKRDLYRDMARPILTPPTSPTPALDIAEEDADEVSGDFCPECYAPLHVFEGAAYCPDCTAFAPTSGRGRAS